MNNVRALVSKKKIRFKEDGYDLDLTYITPHIISMGFPSEGKEALYRNKMKDVQRLFEERHKDKYRVYNLCSERSYDAAKFQGRVEVFAFDDHNPPHITLMKEFCEHTAAWLKENEGNVVAIHCKAGKGRTGTMIACLLQHLDIHPTPQAALQHFGFCRTSNGKGVTIPSQMRYVHYYQRILMANRQNHPPTRTYPNCQPLKLKKIVMHTVPNFDVGGGCDPYVVITNRGKNPPKRYTSPALMNLKTEASVDLDCADTVVEGDFLIQLYDKDKMSDDKMCHAWLHTCFLPHTGQLHLKKTDIDKAIKDKKHEQFSEYFALDVIYERPEYDNGVWDDWDSIHEAHMRELRREQAMPRQSVSGRYWL